MPTLRARLTRSAPWDWSRTAAGRRFRLADAKKSPSERLRSDLRPQDLGVARDELLARVEAALFSAEEPMTPRKLARLAGLADTGEARRQVDRLNRLLRLSSSGFLVEEVAGGYQMLTCPDLRAVVEQVYRPGDELQLSPPMLETLAIIAYRQPICRADIEAIRGVQVGEILKQLMDKQLIRLAGKDDSLGRPYLYGTTKQFLQAFGLRNLHELPMVEMLTPPAEDQVEEEAEEAAQGQPASET
jgi:segregation and condensation protein B